jgi:hypothetical protein
MEQYKYSKEINKLGTFGNSTNLSLRNVLIALFEAPNNEYLDKNSTVTNSVALIDKETMDTLSVSDLKKDELPNWVELFEKKISTGD